MGLREWREQGRCPLVVTGQLRSLEKNACLFQEQCVRSWSTVIEESFLQIIYELIMHKYPHVGEKTSFSDWLFLGSFIEMAYPSPPPAP